MILTGREIAAQVGMGRIHITDFDPERLEPNSYGFLLGDTILEYADEVLSPECPPTVVSHRMDEYGMLLLPDRLYLGSTREAMGSTHHAATLYARLSVATLGVWIQYSAPLGHCGAVIPWTLEIKVASPVRLYPGMKIGKIAFWAMQGVPLQYDGRYEGSQGVVPSLMGLDLA